MKAKPAFLFAVPMPATVADMIQLLQFLMPACWDFTVADDEHVRVFHNQERCEGDAEEDPYDETLTIEEANGLLYRISRGRTFERGVAMLGFAAEIPLEHRGVEA